MSQQEKKNDIQICPECHKENDIINNFCIFCAKQLKENPVIIDYRARKSET